MLRIGDNIFITDFNRSTIEQPPFFRFRQFLPSFSRLIFYGIYFSKVSIFTSVLKRIFFFKCLDGNISMKNFTEQHFVVLIAWQAFTSIETCWAINGEEFLGLQLPIGSLKASVKGREEKKQKQRKKQLENNE